MKKRDSIISSLKNDIDGLKKEIQERDDTIQDKVIIVWPCHHVMTITVLCLGKTYLRFEEKEPRIGEIQICVRL